MKIQEFIQKRINERKSAEKERRRVFKDIISRSTVYREVLGINEEDIEYLSGYEPIVCFELDKEKFGLYVLVVTPSESGEKVCRFCIIASCITNHSLNTIFPETRGGVLEPYALITSAAWHQKICAYLSSGETIEISDELVAAGEAVKEAGEKLKNRLADGY